MLDLYFSRITNDLLIFFSGCCGAFIYYCGTPYPQLVDNCVILVINCVIFSIIASFYIVIASFPICRKIIETISTS